MNLIQRTLQTLLKAAAFPRAVPWQIWSQPGTRVDYANQVDAKTSSIIMACVNWIARTFPEAPPMLSERTPDGLEERPDHPLTALLKSPNPFYSGGNLWMATLLSWVLDGNAYWQKIRSASTGVVELWYIPHDLITPKWPAGSTDIFIDHYSYAPAGMPTRLAVEDIVHFRQGLDPANIRKGLSPLRSLMREIWTDAEAANFVSTLLRNSGVPGLVISPDGEMAVAPSPDEIKEAKAAYQQNTTGDHRGEPLILKGPTKVQQFGFSPEQMNTRSLRQIPEERVTAVLGIPAAVVGLGTGLEQTKVGATMRELRELAYENNIIPTQRLMSQEITTQLLPDFAVRPAQFAFGFDLREVRVLQDDENKKAERWVKLVQGGVATRAEGREAQGLVVEESDKVYLQQVSIVEVPVDDGESDPAEAEGVPAGVVDVARLALNGAQVTALLGIIEQVAAGSLTPRAGSAVIKAAFPSLSDPEIEQMIGGAIAPPPEPDPEDETRALKWPELKATRSQSTLMRQFRRDHVRLESLFTSELVEAFDDLGNRAFRAANSRAGALSAIKGKTLVGALVDGFSDNGHIRATRQSPTSV